MNTVTANKIKAVAEMAHEDCFLTSMKNAKSQITNRCKVFAGYESQWQNVDRAEVLEAFEQIMDCRTKAEFTRRCELLIETMINIVIENERAATITAHEDLKAESIRVANRDFGYWITGEQVDAILADHITRTPAQVARECVNAIKDAERRAALADTLAAAQTAYNAAQLATVEALDAAVAASEDGTEDTPEFTAYEASEAALTVATGALLKAAGRYAVDTARALCKPVADIEALKTMFMPAFTDQIENYHPGRRNELVSKALAFNPNGPQTA